MTFTRNRLPTLDRSRTATRLWCYIFVAPALVLAALFTFYPMVMSWVYSTVDWTGFTSDIDFVGLGNYRELLGDELFWNAFGRSMVFVLVGTPIRVVGALLVAMVLNQQALKLAPAFRTLFFMPVVTTAAIVGIVMSFVMGSYRGPLNEALVGAGVLDAPFDFLGNTDSALWVVLLTHTWKNFGITMIYWLAALQTVPKDLYEAGKVDGAGAFGLLRHITVPVLLPFAVVIIVLTANENLHAFALVQAMTEGGPFFSTQVIEVYIYQTAFAADTTGGGVPRLGYASAAGCFFGTAALVLALVQAIAVRKTARIRNQLKA